MNAQIAVIGVWAEDVPKAAHFYRDLLGLPLLCHAAGRPHFDLGGSFLVILQGQPCSPKNAVPERFPILAFKVDDLDAAVEELHARAIEMPWGIESDENSRWVMFHDPGGNLIELVQFES